MKILIYTLALISAFFVSAAYSVDYIDSDYLHAEAEYTQQGSCHHPNQLPISTDKEQCKALAMPTFGTKYPDVTEEQSGEFITFIGFCDSCGHMGRPSSVISLWKFKLGSPELTGYRCPPDANPDHKIGPVKKDPNEDEAKWCLPETVNRCPAPTENDPFVFGLGGQTNVCFDNPDGTQCKIETADDGSYYIPISYGSQEPVRCNERPNKPVDKTPAPEEKPAPEETDPEPEMADLDALNKINENLDSMNTNQVNASDSNDERLDRVAAEIQISNDLLGAIRDKPSGGGTTNVTIDTSALETKQEESNDLQQEILDELKKVNEIEVEKSFDKNAAQSFWESEYENGLEGIWSDKKGDFENTGAFEFIQQFKFNAGGSPPDVQICFNLGSFMDFGCKSLPLPNPSLLAILKIFILITAAFLCRALIFGG